MRGKIVPWLMIIIGLILISRTTATIYRLWKAGERVEEAERELAEVKQANEKLAWEWQEVQTPEYMERQVRDKLGYGKPGEVELVMPENQNPKSKILSSKEDVPNWKQGRKLYLII